MQRLDMKSLGILFVMLYSLSALSVESYGIFLVVKGDIKVTKKDGKTENVKAGLKTFPGETVTSGADSRAKIVMHDKNVIQISPNTVLKIEEYQNDKNGKNAKLSLVVGKIRNTIDEKNKYDDDKNKFQVRTATAVAGVRGTDFLTSYNKETSATEIITFRGTVAVQTFGATPNTFSEPIQVSEGEKTETSSTEANAPPPEAQKVPPKELREIDNETNIKGNAPPAGQQPPPPPPPPPGANSPGSNTPGVVDDVKKRTDQHVQDGITEKHDKARVNIIPKPPQKIIPNSPAKDE